MPRDASRSWPRLKHIYKFDGIIDMWFAPQRKIDLILERLIARLYNFIRISHSIHSIVDVNYAIIPN